MTSVKFIVSFSFVLSLFSCFQLRAQEQNEQMAFIEGGSFTPLYGAKNQSVDVDDFYMDIYPVTNADFLEFVVENPKWRASQVPAIFAESKYLSHWKSDLEIGDELMNTQAVTMISWFAAKNYCEARGKRLPTVDEWEYVAMADQKVRDAREKESYNQLILSWYEEPQSFKKPIGSTFKNYWGIYDLHGLVWEWTADFNSILITGESRKDVDKDIKQFCGSAAVTATDLMNYAAFMRYAFRGSLEANYTIRNQGFRCVKDVSLEPKK